jgi:eukaryotic-like serine/threonine-protein kinase
MRLLETEVANRPTMDEARVMLDEVAAGRAPEPVEGPPPAVTKVLPPTLAATAPLSQHDPGPEPAASRPGVPGSAAAAAFRGPGQSPVAGPAPVTPAPAPARPAAGRGPGGRTRVAVLAGAAALLVVVVVGLALANSGGETPAGTPGTSQAAAPQVTDSAEAEAEPSDRPSTTSAAPSTTTTTTTETGPPSAARVEQFVRGYYGMLPGNPSAAWAQLSPEYQAVTGGYTAYTQFWSTIGSVSIGSVRPSDDGSAVATVTYTMSDGSVQSESRSFRVVPAGGRLVITDSQLV